MLAVISPAKTLDYDTPAPFADYTQPALLAESALLIERLRQLQEADIASLMKVSSTIAALNHRRYQLWQPPFTPGNAKQALFAFQGDVYQGLDAASLTHDDCLFAQQHLRMLSGLYGLLRPFDLMQAYRLEMGTSLSTERGKDLYAFWGDIISLELKQALQDQADDCLINLASQEYFKAVRPKLLGEKIIHIIFKERRGLDYAIIGVYAKRARGLMCRYMIQNRLSKPQQLQQFDLEGYQFAAGLSDDSHYVFTRDSVAPASGE